MFRLRQIRYCGTIDKPAVHSEQVWKLWIMYQMKYFLSQADKDSFLNAEYRNVNWFMHKGVTISSDPRKFPR